LSREKTNSKKEEYLIHLNDKKNQNTWIIGTPPVIELQSPNYSELVQISHSRIPPVPSNIEEFHSHEGSEEYYLVIRGYIKVRVHKKVYQVNPMNLLSIPKKIPHKIIDFKTPLQYFTIRTPSSRPEEKRIHKM
jgi:mannose-6-phosphate isomerase-like protein (cupin superfamily)